MTPTKKPTEALYDRAHEQQVTELLNRLKELVPSLARSRKNIWMSRFRNAMAVVAAFAFILAGIALVRVGIVSRNASQHSGQVSACINNVLGVRSVTTEQETKARKQYAKDQLKFAEGQSKALKLIAARDPKAGTYLLMVEADFASDSRTFIQQLSDIEDFRKQHPLGVC